MRIAIIDDEEDWRFLSKSFLEALLHECEIFTELPPVELVAGFDIVSCDNKFNYENEWGFDFLKKLRLSGYRGVAVLYTNFPRDSDIRNASRFSIEIASKDEPLYKFLASRGFLGV